MQNEVTGLVLKATQVNDYDRRIVILTKERGKIAAFVRGARRSNNALTAASQPFTYGSFQVFAGRDSYRLQTAEITQYFEKLKQDVDGIAYGSYFCEVVDYMTRENIDCKEYLKLLYVTLRALEKQLIPPALIRRIFELRALQIDGEEMQAFACVRCGNAAESYVLRAEEGGLVCTEHCAGDYDLSEVLHPDTVYTLQYILSTDVTKLYSFSVKDYVMQELSRVVETFFQTYVEHTFQSLGFLESMTCNLPD